MSYLLLLSVFVIATCGLVYELVAGTLASYLLGDSVTQFSTVIGVYLFSMGIGSYLSKYVRGNLVAVFIQVELIIGLVGGFSAALLFASFHYVTGFRTLLYSMVALIGTLVGLEIPLLMRILKDRFEFKDLVSKVFTFDYIGALVASLLFPLLLIPRLGLIRTSLLFGIFNVLVALWALHLFRNQLGWPKLLRGAGTLVLILLGLGFAYSGRIQEWSETAAFSERIVFSKSSDYQRIVLTSEGDEMRLYLNGHLQFSSRDEYRYHEALVHVGLRAVPQAKRVLVLGGGDGLAVREILKYPEVESVTLVDLDPEVTHLFQTQPLLTKLNGGALSSPKVSVVNADAFIWAKQAAPGYDFIVVDFPDPTNFSLGKLYTTAFYRELERLLAPEGLAVVQSTSPLVARKSFWCVNRSLNSVGLKTLPYHVYVPSFGEWGFILAGRGEPRFAAGRALPADLKFLRESMLPGLTEFPPDMAPVETEVNQLNNQALVRYYEEEWARYPGGG